MLKKYKRIVVLKFIFIGLIVQLQAQYFSPIPISPISVQRVRLSGTGYLSSALPGEDGLSPAVKLTLSLLLTKQLRTVFEYNQSPGFNKYEAQSISTQSIIFPDKNNRCYFFHISMPYRLRDDVIAKRVIRLTADPFVEMYYLSPNASALNAFSMDDNTLSYESITVQLGSRTSWQYYPKRYRYSVGGGLFYYRTKIINNSLESFRNMFGDPYLPGAYRGLGGDLVASLNDFSVGLEFKQNIKLVHASDNRATVNGQSDVRKLSEIEGMHWNVEVGWTGEILSF